MIELKIWDYKQDEYLIDSFLEAASKAHGMERFSQSWFKWKFECNPNGPAILACAIAKGKVVGCVAFSNYPFKMGSSTIAAAISCETFVHPDFQGKGLFKKLIALAEEELRSQNVKILLNFPNSNSLKGFLSTGWGKGGGIKLKAKLISVKSILYLKDIRKRFVPFYLEKSRLNENDFQNQIASKTFESAWSREYILWRFNMNDSNNYDAYHSNGIVIIYRIGTRGKLKEAQILKVFTDLPYDKINFKEFEKAIIEKHKIDILMSYLSDNHPLLVNSYYNISLSLPNKVNVCEKILDTEFVDIRKNHIMLISAGDFHTF